VLALAQRVVDSAQAGGDQSAPGLSKRGAFRR
jgi:hypothetical protein